MCDAQWRFVGVTDADVHDPYYPGSSASGTASSTTPYRHNYVQDNTYAAPPDTESLSCEERRDFSYANHGLVHGTNWHTSPSSVLDDDQTLYRGLSYHQSGHPLELPHGLHTQFVDNGGYQASSSIFTPGGPGQFLPISLDRTTGHYGDTGSSVPMSTVPMPYSEPHHSKYAHGRISRHASTATTTYVESYSQPSVPLDDVPGYFHRPSNSESPNTHTCQWDGCGLQLGNVTLRGVREHLREHHFRNRSPPLSGKDMIECRWGGNCGRDKMQWENLPKHLAECHFRSMTRVCDQCGGSFARGDTLRRHQESGSCFQGRHPVT
ncbi:hypothetical protein NUW54_g1974 [Trametes sanguinea]|uniref:Uncharacterized protein n=1 Tax=Trametes sanguinea TaxID=158606 RepID=A0ACC1Q7S6_9APHY|nr:hypothetical protein NUW54_g1974 [Trametes sanguinea]